MPSKEKKMTCYLNISQTIQCDSSGPKKAFAPPCLMQKYRQSFYAYVSVDAGFRSHVLVIISF